MRGNGTLCPKCALYSEDDETCDNCGANIARIVARQSGDEFGFDTTDKKMAAMEEYANERRTSPFLVGLIVVGLAIAIWMNVDFYLASRRDAAEASSKTKAEQVEAASNAEAEPQPDEDQSTTTTAEIVSTDTPVPAIVPKRKSDAELAAQEKQRQYEVEQAQEEARQLIKGMQTNVPERARVR